MAHESPILNTERNLYFNECFFSIEITENERT